MTVDADINCTAKLYSYRKTREGTFVQFVIHPNEVPAKLQTDPIGTSYMLGLLEVDDSTGQPKGGVTENSSAEKPRPATPTSGGARSYAQEAGRLCNDVRFLAFLSEKFYAPANIVPDEAADIVRAHCEVDSRSKIVEGTFAGDQWKTLVAEYELERVA